MEELKRGVPAKKETMKKRDLPFADRARTEPDSSDVNGNLGVYWSAGFPSPAAARSPYTLKPFYEGTY